MSPDAPQLGLGETDEENSTEPHFQRQASPSFANSLSLLAPSSSSSSSYPLASLKEWGALLLHSPTFRCISSLPHTDFCPHLSQSSLSLLGLFVYQSNFCAGRSMAAQEMTNSCKRGRLRSCTLSVLCSNLIISSLKITLLPPHSLFCLSLSRSTCWSLCVCLSLAL